MVGHKEYRLNKTRLLITFCRLENPSCLLARSDGQTICLAQFLYIARGSFRVRENASAWAGYRPARSRACLAPLALGSVPIQPSNFVIPENRESDLSGIFCPQLQSKRTEAPGSVAGTTFGGLRPFSLSPSGRGKRTRPS